MFRLVACLAGAFVAWNTGCDRPGTSGSARASAESPPESAASDASADRSDGKRPNVVWIVWDTVRADHLGLYGYGRPTSPNLDRFAREARVFDDCVSPSSHTIPSHASMFTGLMPSEHGADNSYQYLDEDETTIAELLRDAGYQTLLWSANPHVSRDSRFSQGFATELHPWDRGTLADARRILKEKTAADRPGSELATKLAAGRVAPWNIKAAGELALPAAEKWLAARDAERPYFIFLNFMEAHRPLVPRDEFRRRMLTPEQVEQSHRIDFAWVRTWAYVYRLSEIPTDELELLVGLYDAAIAELDECFGRLIATLRERGDLENTIVIVTADHGEHLGDHHMLDHQYSLYGDLLRVPLIVRFPPRFAAGRETRPVMSHDIFPTLLELCGAQPPSGFRTTGVSLLAPAASRERVAEYPAAFEQPYGDVSDEFSAFDPGPWRRSLRSFQTDRHKLIRGSDGRYELYDLTMDAREQHDIAAGSAPVVRELTARLDAFTAALRPAKSSRAAPQLDEEHMRRLQGVGYVSPGDSDAGEKRPTSRPKSRSAPPKPRRDQP